MKKTAVKQDSLQDIFRKQKVTRILAEIHLKSGHTVRGRVLEYDHRGRIFLETSTPRAPVVIYEDAIEYIIDKTLPLYVWYSEDDSDAGDTDEDQ